jgi:hypothetical protein
MYFEQNKKEMAVYVETTWQKMRLQVVQNLMETFGKAYRILETLLVTASGVADTFEEKRPNKNQRPVGPISIGCVNMKNPQYKQGNKESCWAYCPQCLCNIRHFG